MCTAEDDCLGVGFQALGGSQVAGISARWSGGTWTTAPMPGTGLLVSCLSSDSCVALTTSGGTEEWDGSTWTVLPGSIDGALLSGLSCTSATACVAVGSHYDGVADYQSALYEWDGTVWSRVGLPSPANDGRPTGLASVSCPAAGSCLAVGQANEPGNGTQRAIVYAQRSGAWVLVAAPAEPAGTDFNRLTAVSCSAANVCTATATAAQTTYVARWNGHAWTSQPSPADSARGTQLLGVSCPTDAFCVAVGYQLQTNVGRLSYAQIWNG